MKIKKLYIENLRNHTTTNLEFGDGLNIFYGLNGSGKTTIIEAIAITSFTKSFLPVQDSSLIKFNEESYKISLEAKNDYEIPYKISVNYTGKSKKEINSNIGSNLSPKDVIGEMPTIVLSPDYKSITFGAPQDRRDFLDRLLSQSSKVYLEDLMHYRRILKQRNSLLYQAKSDYNFDKSSVEHWSNILITKGAEIILRRLKFASEFTPYFDEVYNFVSNGSEKVTINYMPYGFPENQELKNLDKEKIAEILSEICKKNAKDEFRRGITLFGPQKDDIKITVNGGLAKETASQGQHKSLLIAIKFAEFNYLRNKKNETPIALLDDIFSELDKERSEKVIKLVNMNYAQTFITLTDISHIIGLLPEGINYKIFEVSSGKVIDKN
jgi:DNA replication and repair protein RecF